MGFEPTTFTLATCKPTTGKSSENNDLANHSTGVRSACAARSARKQPHDADLRALIDAWPELPKAIKAGIVAMVNAKLATPVGSGVFLRGGLLADGTNSTLLFEEPLKLPQANPVSVAKVGLTSSFRIDRRWSITAGPPSLVVVGGAQSFAGYGLDAAWFRALNPLPLAPITDRMPSPFFR